MPPEGSQRLRLRLIRPLSPRSATCTLHEDKHRRSRVEKVNDRAPDREMANIWSALRRRKVVQWGLVYVAGAWGFLQGLEYVSEAFHWPDQLRQIALIALLIGLPVVLVLAWYHGDRGQQRITTPEFAILTLLLLLGGGAFWYYQRASDTPASADTATAPAATTKPPESAPLPDEKSIAVLPFADMSPQKDQEYMSDGIAEELLNLLAKIPDLKVIARTSSFAFKGDKVPISEIAKRLNVAHVVEGSVRKAGDRLRITAQLIRAADSAHLWSETYDRDLADIFAIQDEIAGAIADTLQTKLTGGSSTRRYGGTENLEAYELYLRAIRADEQTTKTSVEAAGEYLQRAVKLDPNYAAAWVALAGNIVGKADLGLLDTVEAYERARKLTRHALQLSPDLADAHSYLAYISMVFDWDWAAVEAGVNRAQALDPGSALTTAGKLATVLGHWEDAERQFRVALARDPLDSYAFMNLAIAYYLEGRYAEAEGLYRRLLELEPGFLWTRIYLGKNLLAMGKPDEALAMVQEEADEAIRLLYLPIVLQAAGKQAEADDALKAQIVAWAETGAYFVAKSYAYRGDSDLAFEWLERSYEQKDPGLIEITGEPLLDGIAADPRFKAFLRKMNIPDVW